MQILPKINYYQHKKRVKQIVNKNLQLKYLERQKTTFDNEDSRVHYSEDDSLSESDPNQTDEDSNYSDSHHDDSTSSSSDSCENSLNDQTIGQDDNISSRNYIPENTEGSKPKKRVWDESKWKRNIINRLRITGQEYLSWKNREVPKRIMEPWQSLV